MQVACKLYKGHTGAERKTRGGHGEVKTDREEKAPRTTSSIVRGGAHLRRRVHRSRSDGRDHPADLPVKGQEHAQRGWVPAGAFHWPSYWQLFDCQTPWPLHRAAALERRWRGDRSMACATQFWRGLSCRVPAVALAILDHPSIGRAILLNSRALGQ